MNLYQCSNPISDNFLPKYESRKTIEVKKKVLIFTDKVTNLLLKRLVYLIGSVKFNVKISHNKLLPLLEDHQKGSFALIVFTKLDIYLHLDKHAKERLKEYCLNYKVGLLIFVQNEENIPITKLSEYPLFFATNNHISNYRVNASSPVLRITKPGYHVFNNTSSKWTLFHSKDPSFEPISVTNCENRKAKDTCEDGLVYAAVMRDKGLHDGIEKIYFNDKITFWVHKLIILDAISYLSRSSLLLPLERYILVDIDDIFLANSPLKMKKQDVKELVNFQNRIRKENVVENFTFNLGFSGKYYRQGNINEMEGDEFLLASRHNFTWFDHTWSHVQPHKLNFSSLVREMLVNKKFAKIHDLPLYTNYSVAPHHSGVYPVHDDLYEAWRQVWGLDVTSTEEYPNLYPAKNRKGFIYKGIKVLPRQTCNLFTHTNFFDTFPGGRTKLDNSIFGGDLFMTVITNIVTIFMTHLSNYGSDRLALYTFTNLFNFIKCWTNLKMMTVEPSKLADVYFNFYPNEILPLWTNPCNNKRHLEIWSGQKTCKRLPHLIVVGPQKTGTTALYTFLNLHPQIKSNFQSNKTFEEVQFFTDKNYVNGIDWYMNHFPFPPSESTILFEKSANYFTEAKAPLQIHTLLPDTKIICILINPSQRAYSWYQHAQSHKDEAALKHSFYDVITATNSSSDVHNLRNKCLLPGLYTSHLNKWKTHFNNSQLLIVDGENLVEDPISEMEKVQNFLKLQDKLDYSKLLKYNTKKGFFCPVTNGGKLKCLGSGKGRKYSPMDDKSKDFLKHFYKNSIEDLNDFLTNHGYSKPGWLIKEINDMNA
ncbi:hypothetical protein HELRODRAFT_107720 [Helobdella robusta]|uniref:[heparan sulfate]-glucosamine N-sulfotransferase n=1 Tax=Helobdella robusta TaxID=6412 RepID=T1EEC5_HELRO|nr:hypothetical protein HELRODRAFT_107720 [Helobdella robusta]ESN94414.1 hypothetical protein HELRODRAFT_107720 [Helobdella robusta]